METQDQASTRAKAWLEVSDLLDLQLAPLGQRALDALVPERSHIIVDIGCGTGKTVLQLAAGVGPEGQVIGVDIAPLLLARARSQTAGLKQTRIVECDAAHLDLPDGSVDGVYSRFGIMAFENPVAAFANIHRFMKKSGKLAFVCWRSLADNELDAMPLRATGLEAHVDQTPFSFEDPKKIRFVLRSAGFEQIVIVPHDEPVSSGGVEAMLTVLLTVGALGKIVRENPTMRKMAEPRLRAALETRDVQGLVALNAAVWVVTAVA